MKKRKLNRGVAIVGAGMSKFGMFKDRDSKDLFTEAIWRWPPQWIKVWTRQTSTRFTWVIFPMIISPVPLGADHRRHHRSFAKTGHAHGRRPHQRCLPGRGVRHRLRFLRPGAGGRRRGHVQAHYRGGGRGARSWVPKGRVGFTFPGVFGAVATAYFAKYGANREHLMNVTIKSHLNAPPNPKAQLPFTVRI